MNSCVISSYELIVINQLASAKAALVKLDSDKSDIANRAQELEETVDQLCDKVSLLTQERATLLASSEEKSIELAASHTESIKALQSKVILEERSIIL